MSQTTTRLVNDTPEAALLRVRDRNGVDHRLAIDKATGEIAVHQYNEYPADRDACTPDQHRAIRGARASARYTAQSETDANVVRSTEDPKTIRAGIHILETLSEGEFVRYFREYYEAVENPDTDAPIESITTVTSVLYLEGERLEYAMSPALEIETNEGTHWEYTNPADSMVAPSRDPDVLCRLAPQSLPVSFGNSFRSFLIDHLRCQMRDIYWLRDEPIPEDCRLEGPGNPDIERLRATGADGSDAECETAADADGDPGC